MVGDVMGWGACQLNITVQAHCKRSTSSHHQTDYYALQALGLAAHPPAAIPWALPPGIQLFPGLWLISYYPQSPSAWAQLHVEPSGWLLQGHRQLLLRQ